jgi:hypothetical protein
MLQSPLEQLEWNAPAPEMRDGFVVLYATNGETVFTQRIGTRDREVYCGEAPRDLSVPLRGPGYAPAIVGEFRETPRTVAFAAEVWQKRFG